MLKKFLIAVVVTIAFLFVTACGGPTQTSSSPEQGVSLSGHWTMADSSDPSFQIVGDVKNSSVTLTWKSDNVSALYWKGSFDATDVTDGTVIVSQGDLQAMAGSILSSSSKTKEFTYDDDQLSFDFTVQGVTKTIHLEK